VGKGKWFRRPGDCFVAAVATKQSVFKYPQYFVGHGLAATAKKSGFAAWG
jgi:hypothetical protein